MVRILKTMDKKIFVSSSLTQKINKEVGFTWPKKHYGQKIYVDFYVFDPASGEKKRIKKHFDSFTKKKDREAAMDHYIHVMSKRLMEGWNPLVECGNNGLTPIEVVFDKYENSLTHYSRKKTIQNYKSRLSILRSYIASLPFPPKYVYQLNRVFFIEYLDWLMDDREVNARTRNNYKGWISSFCDWLIKRNYIIKNPGLEISKIKEEEKKRRALTKEELELLFNYLKTHDKHFLLACLFEYYTMIRPTELSFLKIGAIDIKNQCVYISGTFSKNRRDGAVSLNRQLIKLMLELGIFSHTSETYLFGSHFKPSIERMGPDQFNKRFVVVRKKLKFTDDLKFYSLKDSGIRDLANARGIVIARDQARHTDISTTNKYLTGRDLRGPEAAKNFTGAYNDD